LNQRDKSDVNSYRQPIIKSGEMGRGCSLGSLKFIFIHKLEEKKEKYRNPRGKSIRSIFSLTTNERSASLIMAFSINNEILLWNKLVQLLDGFQNNVNKEFAQGDGRHDSSKVNCHILIADDDEDDRMFFSDAITAIAPSAKLTEAFNGDDLITKLMRHDFDLPDLIFLDLNMPYKNGLECLKEIRSTELLKSLPILIYSTSLNRDHVDISYLNGANMYIQKPVSYDGIKRILKTIFSLHPLDWFQQPPREKFILK